VHVLDRPGFDDTSMTSRHFNGRRVTGLLVVALIATFALFGSFYMFSAAEIDGKFAHVLISPGPSPQIPASAVEAYNWLIGDWEADVYDYGPGGAKQVSKGEWHFSWVLEGRAIQDVWVVPRRSDRNPSTPPNNNRYGTSIRIYDPKIDAWRVFWFNPVTSDRTELVGRKVGNAIVQQSVAEDGSFTRWTFEDITTRSFTWRGEFSTDGGRTWHLDAEFLAHRMEGLKR
jgi:hypothetical protein